jgi:enoyl-CoA hydratase/carnithine racemase
MLRLELGITPDLLGVARVLRARLTRAEYLRLRGARLRAMDALARASVDELAEHLASDKARAKSLLER